MWVFGFEWNTWEIKVVLVLDEGKREEDEHVFSQALKDMLMKTCLDEDMLMKTCLHQDITRT